MSNILNVDYNSPRNKIEKNMMLFFQKKKIVLIIKIRQKLIKNQKLIGMRKNMKFNFNINSFGI